jgi:hypothetical protein
MPLDFDRFVRARVGLVLDEELVGRLSVNSLSSDTAFLKAIGCNSPKLYLVTNPVIVNDMSEAARLVKDNPDLYGNPVVYDKNANPGSMAGAAPGVSSNANAPKGPGIVVSRFSANNIELSVDAGLGQWLVYLDNYHPSWRAYVNGKSVPIAQANIAFKAVKLEEGHNTVRFSFENLKSRLYTKLLFITGVLLALVVLASALLLSMPSALIEKLVPQGYKHHYTSGKRDIL